MVPGRSPEFWIAQWNSFRSISKQTGNVLELLAWITRGCWENTQSPLCLREGHGSSDQQS